MLHFQQRHTKRNTYLRVCYPSSIAHIDARWASAYKKSVKKILHQINDNAHRPAEITPFTVREKSAKKGTRAQRFSVRLSKDELLQTANAVCVYKHYT